MPVVVVTPLGDINPASVYMIDSRMTLLYLPTISGDENFLLFPISVAASVVIFFPLIFLMFVILFSFSSGF